jgi:hypothetical protein
VKIADTVKTAHVSPCGVYRFTLTRTDPAYHPNPALWRTAVFVLNNPSVADMSLDDPTATRGWAFTESWGYNRMVFLNTNPRRATDPRNAMKPDPWAREINDAYLRNPRSLMGSHGIIICAWGDKAHKDMAKDALRQLHGQQLHYLGDLTKTGNPRHILYLKGDLRPTAWTP